MEGVGEEGERGGWEESGGMGEKQGGGEGDAMKVSRLRRDRRWFRLLPVSVCPFVLSSSPSCIMHGPGWLPIACVII